MHYNQTGQSLVVCVLQSLVVCVLQSLVVSVLEINERRCLRTCYSAAYVSETRAENCFMILVVAADWHELMVLH